MIPQTPPVEIAAWLACLAFVVMLVNGVMRVVDRLKDKPAPGEVRAESAALFMSKSEFQQHAEWNRREHENLYSKIGGVERGVSARLETRLDNMQREANERGEKVHGRINEVLEAVSELRGTVNELRR